MACAPFYRERFYSCSLIPNFKKVIQTKYFIMPTFMAYLNIYYSVFIVLLLDTECITALLKFPDTNNKLLTSPCRGGCKFFLEM